MILFFFPPTFPHKELLAPQQVFAKSEGMDKLMVTWTPPDKATTAVQEYVVEWRELHPGAGMQPPLGWLWYSSHAGQLLWLLVAGGQMHWAGFSQVGFFELSRNTLHFSDTIFVPYEGPTRI